MVDVSKLKTKHHKVSHPMNDYKTDKQVVRMKTPPLEPRLLEAEPENLEIDLKRLAVVSVDMLNAFATKGAFHDLLGWDLTEAQKTIKPNKQLKTAARRNGVKVIYCAHRFSLCFGWITTSKKMIAAIEGKN